jgi:hypothetical protein
VRDELRRQVRARRVRRHHHPARVFIVYLLLSRRLAAMYPVIAALLLACFMGFLGTMWMLRELLVPDRPHRRGAARLHREARAPRPADHFPDRAGKLMEGTQYTLSSCTRRSPPGARLRHRRPHRHLQPPRRREAPREEVARAERDLQVFQLAFFDINDFKPINDRHGHSAGDACISHLADLLQLNTRRGDWVARWGGDEFIVGLHRNRALKMVMERIVNAIGASPCEIAPGWKSASR